MFLKISLKELYQKYILNGTSPGHRENSLRVLVCIHIYKYAWSLMYVCLIMLISSYFNVKKTAGLLKAHVKDFWRSLKQVPYIEWKITPVL